MSTANDNAQSAIVRNDDAFVPEIYLWGINTPVCAAFLVNKPVFTLGKAETCDGILAFSEEISREHARITFKDGLYYLSDLDSLNKTFLNGHPLIPNEQYPIAAGDRVTLSIYSFNVDRINR